MNRVQREFTRTLRKDVSSQFLAAKKKGKKFNFTTDKYAGYKKGILIIFIMLLP